MGGELMGDLLPSVQLDVCQGHDYYGHPRRTPHTKSVDFFLAYTQADVKSEIFMEPPIGFGVEGGHPI